MTPDYPMTTQCVRDTLVARGELTEEEIDSYLTRDGDDEAQGAYETFIAPAINRLEDAIVAERSR